MRPSDAAASVVTSFAFAYAGAGALAGYTPMIAAFGVGHRLRRLWLRSNLSRLQP